MMLAQKGAISALTGTTYLLTVEWMGRRGYLCMWWNAIGSESGDTCELFDMESPDLAKQVLCSRLRES